MYYRKLTQHLFNQSVTGNYVPPPFVMNKAILIMHLRVLKNTKKDVSLHDPIGQDIDYENKNE
ncbi:hypothetical protein AU385_15505 [Bacillus halotolerans]|nr:hypothetical protein AU385_15505 [Bacillus halotolerans]